MLTFIFLNIDIQYILMAGLPRAARAAALPAQPRELVGRVGRRGLSIHFAALRDRLGGQAEMKKILGALTVVERPHPGKPRHMRRTTRPAFSIVREADGEHLIIPRVKGRLFLETNNRAGVRLLDRLAEDRPLPPPRRLDPSHCEIEEPLYAYQEAAVDYLCGPAGPFGGASIAAHRGSAYLQMDPGLGKSRVGCVLVARRGEPALIVVPTVAIGEQWVDEFAEVLPEMNVGIYHNTPKGSRKVPPGPKTHDVVIIIVNTFRGKKPEFMEGYGTTILDEAHEYYSVHNSRALWLAQTRAVLGLSATPNERPDGLDRYVHYHLGPVIYPETIPGFDAGDVNFRGAVTIVEYAGHPTYCETATTPSGTMSAILTIGNVIEDPHRMRLVAAETHGLLHLHETAPPDELASLGLGPRPESAATPKHPAGEIRRHGVFVFAEHREYLPALRAQLRETLGDELYTPELEGRPGRGAQATKQVSILRGGVSRSAVREARTAGAHVVLTTYGFSRRGISLPDMTAIVHATPRRNGARQILGRITRRGSDESILRQVVDIVDTRTGLRGQLTDRKKIYSAKGYPVAVRPASWESYVAQDPGPLGDGIPQERPTAGPAPEGVSEQFAGMTTDELLELALGFDGDGDEPGDGDGAVDLAQVVRVVALQSDA